VHWAVASRSRGITPSHLAHGSTMMYHPVEQCWADLQRRPSSKTGSCIVKNTFLHIVEQLEFEYISTGISRQLSEPAMLSQSSDPKVSEYSMSPLSVGSSNSDSKQAVSESRQSTSDGSETECDELNKVDLTLASTCAGTSSGCSTRQASRLSTDEHDADFVSNSTLSPKAQAFTPQHIVDATTSVATCDDGQMCAEAWGRQRKQMNRKLRLRADPMSWDSGVVTVMVRQIPRTLTTLMLLKEVNSRGFEGLFNFMYLPFEMKKGINVGYGFINFTEPAHAQRFRDAVDGTYLDKQMKLKVKPLRVHPASVQGYEANYQHFVQTKTGQKGDPSLGPLFLPAGELTEDAQQALLVTNAAVKPRPRRSMDATEAPSGGMPWYKKDEEICTEMQQGVTQFIGCHTCATCGVPYRAEHNFCAQCGARLQHRALSS